LLKLRARYKLINIYRYLLTNSLAHAFQSRSKRNLTKYIILITRRPFTSTIRKKLSQTAK